MNYPLKRILVLSALLLLACSSCVNAATPRGGEATKQRSSSIHQQPAASPRRVMENENRRRRRSHYHNYPNRYSMQEEQQKKKKYYNRTHEASLSDVWLCYAFALGWATWFLSSFLNTDLMRFAESDSVLVHGNVREVSIEDDSLGTGIPTYHALIDYIITVRREAEQARIQVRKSFQTQHLLQQGFANVELLVLPEEPTSSVLKEDWQREVAAQEQAEEDIISIGGFGDFDMGGDTVFSSNTEKDGRKQVSGLSRIDVWAKRTSLILSGILVTASLIGAVQTVHCIHNEKAELIGWISVVIGSVLLWPLAMTMLRLVAFIQHLGRLPSEKTGIILKCDTNAQGEAIINDDRVYTQHHDIEFNRGNVAARHVDRVSHPDVYEKLKNNSNEEESSIPEDSSDAQVAQTMKRSSINTTGDESACYFVKLPGQKEARLDDSSMSTISSNSYLSKGKRNSESST